MGKVLLFPLCLGVGGLIVGWGLGRFGVTWGWLVSFFARLLLNLVAALAFAWTAVEAAALGGAWYALAAALAVLALWMLALVVLFAWGVLKHRTALED